MMRPLPPVLVLLLGACQDYRLHPGEQGDDSGGGLMQWEGPGERGEVLPPSNPSPPDTDPPICDFDQVAAAPYGGQASCRPLRGVSWELEVERVLDGLDASVGYIYPPVAVPGLDGSTTIFALMNGHGPQKVVGYNGATGAVIHAVSTSDELWYMPSVFRGRGATGGLFAAIPAPYDGVGFIDFAADSFTFTTKLEEQNYNAAVRDLWHDGEPEFISGSFSYSLQGDLLEDYPWSTDQHTGMPALADTDGDGRVELANAHGWWDTITQEGYIWRPWINRMGRARIWGGFVRYEGEVLYAGHNVESHFVADREGFERWLDPPDNGYEDINTSAPPSIGDLDGDGVPELVVDLYYDTMVARHLDGTILWERRTARDTGSLANTHALADLNADGRYEVVVWGTLGLWILDGVDGSVLARWKDAYSWSFLQVPLVADVDDDGSAEIVVVGWTDHDESDPHIYILGPAEGRWARTRPVWNQIGYDVTSVRDDGTVPAFPRPNFDTYNSLRAQPAHDGHHPDLEIEVLETCRDEEAGTVAVHAVVHNRGSKDAPEGAVVRLMSWSEDSGTGLQDVASHTIPVPIPTMTSAESVVFELTTEQWATRQVLQVDGAHDDECDWVNDRVDVWED
jgi:hypothetical protein